MNTFLDCINNPDDKFGQYLRYLAHQEGVGVEEAARRSIDRLFGRMEKPRDNIIIITAFRGENTLAQNRVLNLQLSVDIRANGWGCTPVLGGFVEDRKCDNGEINKAWVQEESFFVNAPSDNRQVIRKVGELLSQYHQRSALIKPADSREVFDLSADGSMNPLGTWRNDPQEMAACYAKMRHGQSRRFTFEAARDDTISTRMAIDVFLKKH